MKDAVATMGMTLPDDAGGRDAVHVAVFSASADVKLFPGQDVCLLERKDTDCVVGPGAEPVGVVDPFLKGPAMPGERFWVYLYPRTITALSHRWSHPSFETANTTYARPAEKLSSEDWLRDFCDTHDCPPYEKLMQGIDGGYDEGDGYHFIRLDGDYIHVGGQDASGEIPPEFWKHVEVVLGRTVQCRAEYFTCSC